MVIWRHHVLDLSYGRIHEEKLQDVESLLHLYNNNDIINIDETSMVSFVEVTMKEHQRIICTLIECKIKDFFL